MRISWLFLLILAIFFINEASAAHFIVGTVNNSADGTSANGKVITLWLSFNQSNNISDTIGPSGNSFTSNFYFLDCELMTIPCQLGDNLTVKVFDAGDGYNTRAINVTVTGAGFDLVTERVLNSPPKLSFFNVDDDISSPLGEIDLTAGSERLVSCTADFYDYENDTITFNSSRFFDNTLSSYFSVDDKNSHYTNGSCSVSFNASTAHTFVNCSHFLTYYSNSNTWNCTFNVTDYTGASLYYSNRTFVNKLLSFSVPNQINYGNLTTGNVSNEVIFNVSNFGNTILNLSLYGYAVNQSDNLSMNCSIGQNISVYYQKYNVTASNSGNLTLSQFESRYKNLTSSSVNNKFNLIVRQNDITDDAINATYWRIYVPLGSAGTCSGRIVFGATQASGI